MKKAFVIAFLVGIGASYAQDPTSPSAPTGTPKSESPAKPSKGKKGEATPVPTAQPTVSPTPVK